MVSLLAVLSFLALPSPAHAALESGPLEIGMYGRMGVAWNPQNGQFVQGQTLNLLGVTLGGRFEEGDYLEPTIKLHIVRPSTEDTTKTYFHFVLTPSMFSANGSFLGAFANNFSANLRIELFQAYLEAGNIFVPDLKVWAGQRFYRGTDVHIADYFYFNNLASQGFGAKYKGLDVAVLLQTNRNQGLYAIDQDGDPNTSNPLIQRQRTTFVGQYVLPVMEKHSLQFLGEFHYLPAARTNIGSQALARRDYGYVGGVKGRLDLGNGSFNELSVRVGGGIANGAFGASQTWSTYGRTNEDDRYGGALGVEAVEHILVNVNPLLSLNGYGIFQYSQGASGLSQDHAMNFATGVRSFLYLHNQFHLINELSFQGVATGLPEGVESPPLPWATKFSIVPTIVPSGERSAWARPHLRFIYTLAYYSEGARSAARANSSVASPYLRNFGPREFGHFLGARAEWWF
ncbi:carbohydrate porin [Hyalangium rubrum]|uniref:Carbohydrate porin n=1 Tax=Hyalangium rubrum TaxID=3103134 RepID=A0ABU5HCC7_9BACT|nr:carbohydrate porin [Hyalangium sp. s54d21]MDY7231110.1 carbohydrate porin [Hyalangium sp. s54d21]